MSGRLVGEVLDHAPADLTTAELLVLIAIAESAKDADRTARYRVSVEDLSWRTRLKAGTIRNALSTLVNRGLLRPLVERVSRGGKHQEYAIARLDEGHRFCTLTTTERPNQ